MDLGKLKIEVYDFFAVIIPGLLLISELSIALTGWATYIKVIQSLNGPAFTFLLLISFALGQVLQECGDVVIKKWKGPRYLRGARDKLWTSPIGQQVRDKITKELKSPPENVDFAFDYCLTLVQQLFAKRDLFVTNSDIARSLIITCALAFLPLIRVVASLPLTCFQRCLVFAACELLTIGVARLCWIRMLRFSVFSQVPVFHSYLALPSVVNGAQKKDSESE